VQGEGYLSILASSADALAYLSGVPGLASFQTMLTQLPALYQNATKEVCLFVFVVSCVFLVHSSSFYFEGLSSVSLPHLPCSHGLRAGPVAKLELVDGVKFVNFLGGGEGCLFLMRFCRHEHNT